jgi:uncharacterized protein (DUF362 family)
MAKVVIAPIDTPEKTLKTLFNEFGLQLKDKDVFVKINAVDFRKGCYTSPEIIGASIDVLYELGANKIFVIENSTQGNFTRLVLKVTGIEDVVKERGAKVIYLDEEKSVKVKIGKFEVDFPKILYENLVESRESSFYLNMPKLKTHDMTTVTLSLKNQFGFLYHHDRRRYHSKFDLHQIIAELYGFVKPDFTVVDGEFAVIHGHYPLEKMLDRYIIPMGVYVAGDDALAVDVIAARILGYKTDEVEHLKIAKEKFGVGEIEVVGELSKFNQKYPCKPLGIYPESVKIVKGKELACKEGCVDNTLMVLEMLHVDYNGDGKFSIVFGKGIEEEELENLKPPVMVVGPCAVEEVGETLKEKYGKVVLINYCNDLAAVTATLMKFMGIRATKIVPVSPVKLILTWINAKLHGSTANTPPIF